MDDPRLIISLLALFLALISFCVSMWQAWRSGVIARRPVLAIEYEENSGWYLHNIGNGPALNVIAAQKRVEGKWFNPVRVPPIAAGNSLHMKWLGEVNTTGIGAIYGDFKGRVYSSTCGNDLVRLYVGNKIGFFRESDIGKHWNQPMYEE